MAAFRRPAEKLIGRRRHCRKGASPRFKPIEGRNE